MARLTTILVLLTLLALPGCARQLARRMVDAPNGGRIEAVEAGKDQLRLLGVDRQIIVPVGPPGAKISAWILEPKGTARGTVLVLHGVFTDRTFMFGIARDLQSAGYRAVLVDLRGHGDSTGNRITYGVVEAKDLVQLTDDLQLQGLVGEHLGVYGISYGAAVAIQYAAADKRVSAVVAVAPFATLRDEVPRWARTMVPVFGWMLSDKDYADIVDEAGKRGHFDPDQASPLQAITKTRASVLLVHGDWDWVIPMGDSQRIHAASPENSRLIVLHGLGHSGAWFDLGGAVKRDAMQWFGEHLPTDPPAIPADRHAAHPAVLPLPAM